MSDYMSIQDAASALSVSTKTVRRMISRGDLPAKRIGSRLIRIPASAVASLGQSIPAASRRA